MTATYTTNLGFIEQGTGDNSNSWGVTLNSGMIALADAAIAGLFTISTTGGTVTLTNTPGAANQARNAILSITGTLISNSIILTPSGQSKIYVVANNTTGAFTLTMSAGAGTITIPQGTTQICYTDGTNFYTVGSGGSLQGTASGPIHMDALLFDQPLIKRYQEYYNNIGSVTGAVNLDYNNGNYQSMTLTGNVTLTPINWPASGIGASMTLFCTQDGTGGRQLTFASGTVLVPGGGGLNLSTVPNAVDEVLITTFNGGATLYCAILKSFS